MKRVNSNHLIFLPLLSRIILDKDMFNEKTITLTGRIFHFHDVRVFRFTIGKLIQASLAFIARKTFIFRWNFRLIQK